jgi:hypothetical protein
MGGQTNAQQGFAGVPEVVPQRGRVGRAGRGAGVRRRRDAMRRRLSGRDLLAGAREHVVELVLLKLPARTVRPDRGHEGVLELLDRGPDAGLPLLGGSDEPQDDGQGAVVAGCPVAVRADVKAARQQLLHGRRRRPTRQREVDGITRDEIGDVLEERVDRLEGQEGEVVRFGDVVGVGDLAGRLEPDIDPAFGVDGRPADDVSVVVLDDFDAGYGRALPAAPFRRWRHAVQGDTAAVGARRRHPCRRQRDAAIASSSLRAPGFLYASMSTPMTASPTAWLRRRATFPSGCALRHRSICASSGQPPCVPVQFLGGGHFASAEGAARRASQRRGTTAPRRRIRLRSRSRRRPLAPSRLRALERQPHHVGTAEMFSATATLGRGEFVVGVGLVLEPFERRVAARLRTFGGVRRPRPGRLGRDLGSESAFSRCKRHVRAAPFGYCQAPTLALRSAPAYVFTPCYIWRTGKARMMPPRFAAATASNFENSSQWPDRPREHQTRIVPSRSGSSDQRWWPRTEPSGSRPGGTSRGSQHTHWGVTSSFATHRPAQARRASLPPCCTPHATYGGLTRSAPSLTGVSEGVDAPVCLNGPFSGR